LSQELRTARLLRPRVLVGFRWSHTGLSPGCKSSHNRYIRSFVSQPPPNRACNFRSTRLSSDPILGVIPPESHAFASVSRREVRCGSSQVTFLPCLGLWWRQVSFRRFSHEYLSGLAVGVTCPPSPCVRLSRTPTIMGTPSPWDSRPLGDHEFLRNRTE
jgi:hypothetical protein